MPSAPTSHALRAHVCRVVPCTGRQHRESTAQSAKNDGHAPHRYGKPAAGLTNKSQTAVLCIEKHQQYLLFTIWYNSNRERSLNPFTKFTPITYLSLEHPHLFAVNNSSHSEIMASLYYVSILKALLQVYNKWSYCKEDRYLDATRRRENAGAFPYSGAHHTILLQSVKVVKEKQTPWSRGEGQQTSPSKTKKMKHH